MKALILVGGFGTRLRPLTLSVPKPLVDFANKPMIVHQIEALRDAGCDEVVLAINYQPGVMMAFLEEWSLKLGIKISVSQETTPMGTAGPLALARDKLIDPKAPGSPFFVLNADVICEYPLKDMLATHLKRGAEGTIFVTKVEDPSKYGVVVFDEASGKVDRFAEKPKTYVGNKINAGIYILNPSVLDRIQLRPTSIEREVFPPMAADGKLSAMELPGFWMDIGQPADYLTGLTLYLQSRAKAAASGAAMNGAGAALATGPGFVGNVLVHETAKIGAGCLIGPDVSIGAGCVVEDGARVARACVMRGVQIKAHACVLGSIIGWESIIGRWARVENMAVLGEDVQVADEIFLNGSIILPHKEIKASVVEPGQIIL